MASLPGYAGIPVVGDKSVEFYKDAVAFVDRRIEQYQSRIFLARILNKHTVVVASNSGVHKVLHGKKLIAVETSASKEVEKRGSEFLVSSLHLSKALCRTPSKAIFVASFIK